VARTRNAMVYVDLETLSLRVHRFLPEPLCPDCGELPPISLRPPPSATQTCVKVLIPGAVPMMFGHCACRKCHPCRSSSVVVFVEDAAQAWVSADVEPGDLVVAGDR
jgi:hypothetical protein